MLFAPISLNNTSNVSFFTPGIMTSFRVYGLQKLLLQSRYFSKADICQDTDIKHETSEDI